MRLAISWAACGFAIACFVSCGDSDSNGSSNKGKNDESGGNGASGGSTGTGGKNGTGGTSGSAGKGGTAGVSGQGGKGGKGGTGGTSTGGRSGDAGAPSGGGGEGGGAAGDSGAGGEGGSGEPPSVTITGNKNLSTDAVTPGRTCAEARSYSVSTLSARGAKLTTAPTSDCLVQGDEVLLINLQGTAANHENVGNWELLQVSSVTASDLTFTANKLRSYGASPGVDTGIGIAETDQKVALIRVPRFGSLTVPETAQLGAAAWDGAQGGVVVLRAESLDVGGLIDATSIGYRGGRWSKDGGDCDDTIATEAGESISGLGLPGTARNIGGPGGLSAVNDVPYASNSMVNASAGHAMSGSPGSNPNGRTLGEPGSAYGVNDATKLTMGSGASGNITCDFDVTEPVLVNRGGTAAGIVLLFVDELTVGSAGSISATPPDAGRDISMSGGYVYVRGTTLSVGTGRVTAKGSVAHSVNTPTPAQGNQSSPGYVVLEGTTVTGTTDPPAHVIQ